MFQIALPQTVIKQMIMIPAKDGLIIQKTAPPTQHVMVSIPDCLYCQPQFNGCQAKGIPHKQQKSFAKKKLHGPSLIAIHYL